MTQTPPDILCENCQTIDFVSILTGPYVTALDQRYGQQISGWIPVVDESCQLCRTAATILDNRRHDQSWRSQGHHWRASRPKWLGYRRKGIGSSVVVLVPMVGSDKERGYMNLSSILGKQFLIHESYAQEIQSPYQLVPPISCVDIRIVSPLCREKEMTWFSTLILDCTSSHCVCTSSQRAWSQSFLTQVIDCQTGSLVDLRSPMEYLALSYCWGDDRYGSGISKDKSMPKDVPLTIADAIKVTISLGKRYLWIDRYCILDDQQPTLQITKMNEIYQGAWCTIIALDGVSSRDGISGISRPRPAQMKIHTSAGRLVCPPPTWMTELRASRWSTRAWCYQEAILTPRTLVFARQQVFFACRSHVISEAHNTTVTINTTQHAFLLAPRELSLPLVDRKDGEIFHRHVSEYSSKELTYGSDALQAFKGIISACKVFTYWGLPLDLEHQSCGTAETLGVHPTVSCSADRCENLTFAFAMAWSRDTSSKMLTGDYCRAGLPSWSWVSSPSRVALYQDTVPETFRYRYRRRKSAKFAIPTASGGRSSFADHFLASVETSYVLDAHGIGLVIDSSFMSLSLTATTAEAFNCCLAEVQGHKFPSKLYTTQIEIDYPFQVARRLNMVGQMSLTAVFLFDDSEGLYRQGRFNRHVSKWLLIDNQKPVANRVGIVELDLCLQEDCQFPACSDRSFVQSACGFYLE